MVRITVVFEVPLTQIKVTVPKESFLPIFNLALISGTSHWVQVPESRKNTLSEVMIIYIYFK